MPSSKNQDYEVEKILEKKIQKGRTFYLIKWKGYSTDQNTWEPEANVRNCQNLVKLFEAEQEKTKKSTISNRNGDQGHKNVRSTRFSQSPPKTSPNKSQRSSRNSNRSLPTRKRSSSYDIMLSDDEDDLDNGYVEKKSRSSKRTRRSTVDSDLTPSIDSHNTDILDSDKLDRIVDVRRNKKSNKIEYSIKAKKDKKTTWINSSRLTEEYAQQMIDFLESKYV